MIRTQIQLTEEQARALKAMAARERVSIAELVRRSLAPLLRSPGAPSDERRRRAIAFAGRFPSREGDIAENHDRYLAEDYLA